jgi:hypothetical protein
MGCGSTYSKLGIPLCYPFHKKGYPIMLSLVAEPRACTEACASRGAGGRRCEWAVAEQE